MRSESGSDDDKISTDEKGIVKAKFDENDYLKDKQKLESQGHLIYMLDQIGKELDYLRTKISANETCCATNTAKTGITTSQANAITANTSKTTFPSTITNLEESTASITGFEHSYDSRTRSNSLIIKIDVKL